MNLLIKIYHSLPRSQNWKFWISLALVVKCIFFLFNLFEFHNLIETYHGSFLLTTGDTYSYFDPIDDLISKGEYVYDFRMPGYGLIYYILRLIFSPTNALNFTGIFQILLSAISVYTLGLICQNLFKSKNAFFAGYFIYLISIYTSIYDSYLLSESLCTSFLIFSLYYFTKPEYTKKDLFFSGFCITWSIFLRPVIFPLLIIQVSLLLIKGIDNSFRLKSIDILCFLILFIVVDGTWIIRNEIRHKEFIPLQERSHYFDNTNNYQPGLIKFFQAFEGWEAGKELKGVLDNSKDELFYPKDIYTSKFNIDSLKNLQKIIEELNNPLISSPELESKINFLKENFFVYAKSIKEEKPFVYYFESRVRAAKQFLIQSGSSNLLSKPFYKLTVFKKFIKLFYGLLYYFILLFGFVGLIYLLLTGTKQKNILFLLISFSGLYLMLVYPLIFKAEERRYFVTAYPLFIVGAVFILIKIQKFIGRKQYAWLTHSSSPAKENLSEV